MVDVFFKLYVGNSIFENMDSWFMLNENIVEIFSIF